MIKTRIFSSRPTRGTSLTEVILSMAIVAIAAPVLYSQITITTSNLRDMAIARQIMELRDITLNYVRTNQNHWPDTAQIKLSDDELAQISPSIAAGFIDKYSVRGATITDVYLAFDVADNKLDANRIARHVGADAAVVSPDGVAYGANWAVSAPDFHAGLLVYRVSRDVAGLDTTKYLHRTASDEENLNTMLRDLNMDGNNIYNVDALSGVSARVKNMSAVFAGIDDMTANTAYFRRGANVDGAGVKINSMRVTGDVSGFRTINADNMNGAAYTTNGRIVTDRAKITKSVNVARDLVLKSDTTRTISGFTGISANSVKTPYVSAEEIVFYESFGLTVSGELLMSTNAPLKLGNWTFPNTKAPTFSKLTLTRAALPAAPKASEFGAIMQSGWKSATPKEVSQ